MTVAELIEYLEGFDSESTVRIASQPSWPLECELDSRMPLVEDMENEVVYLVEGNQLGYLSGETTEACGW